MNLATSIITGTIPLTLTDHVATRCVSNANADELPVSFIGGNITVVVTNAQPTLSIVRSNSNVILSWEAWASQFSLQTAPALNGAGNVWTNVSGSPQPSGDKVYFTQPVTNQVQFFRLRR